MSESSAFGYREDVPHDQHPAPAPALRPGQHKFSPDEMRVLQECNRESFFQRSLPCAGVLGMGTYAAIQQGHLKPNPRFGAFPKMSIAVVLGYIIGKLSYQEACAAKLMALPGSYIGQLLRERKDGKAPGSTQKSTPSMFGAGPNDIYSDAGPGNSLDLDTDRPLFNEEAYRHDSEGSKPPPPPPGAPQPRSFTYDELRKRNRGEYTEAKQDPYKTDLLPPISRSPPPPPQTEKKQTNKYGDTME